MLFNIYVEIRATDFLERFGSMRVRIRKDFKIVGLRNGKWELLHLKVNKNKEEIGLEKKFRSWVCTCYGWDTHYMCIPMLHK